MNKCQICAKTFSTTPKPCSFCASLICSASCLHNHITVFHTEEKNQQQQQHTTHPTKHLPSSSSSSPFITEGTFNTDPNYKPTSPSFPFKFEHIKSADNKNRILGSGTFGQVYLMKNQLDNKFYAIKHMRKDNLINNLGTLSVVYREIDLHSRLTHDNIIKLYSYVETKTAFDLIMEYANSGSLFTYIKHNKGFNEDDAFEFFIQVCNAIYFLHKYGLIHRDLKPENILLIDNKKIKLCDFGWCVEKGERSRSTYCGTFEYMAPEMVGRVHYGKSIDIWSLGILLYELLHGYSPFRAVKDKHNSNEIMTNILRHNLVFHKEISVECKKLIEDLLKEDPEQRPTIEDVFMSDFVLKYQYSGINIVVSNIQDQGLVNTLRVNKDKDKEHDNDEGCCVNDDMNECDETEKKDDIGDKIAPGAMKKNPFENVVLNNHNNRSVICKAGHFVDTIREFPPKKPTNANNNGNACYSNSNNNKSFVPQGHYKSQQSSPIKKPSRATLILQCKVNNFLQAKQWLKDYKPSSRIQKQQQVKEGVKHVNKHSVKSSSKQHRNNESRTCSIMSLNTDTQATSFSNISNNIKQSRSFANMLVGIKIK